MMNKITTLLIGLALSLGAASCDKKNEPKKLLDANAKVSIHVTTADGTRAKGTYAKDRDELMQRVNTILGLPEDKDTHWVYAIEEDMKDYDKHIIKMWGNAIINPNTRTITRAFIGARDVVFTDDRIPADTLGYIPNQVLREAEAKIMTAFDKGDYDEVYRLFNEVYQATPITGEEWRALKAQGKQ